MDKSTFLSDPDDVSITYVEIFRDGGTITVVFEDLAGCKCQCCFASDRVLDARSQKNSQRYPGRLFIGAEHPNDEEARLVPLGGIVQKEIIHAITRHLNQRFISSELIEQDREGRLLLACIERTAALMAESQSS